MQVSPSVFKAYDIRGIVGKTIDEAFAEALGRAFGSEALAAGERAVAVGRDGRLSGPALSAALIRGLASTGLDVVDIGAGDDADAVLRGRHARRARLPQRHPGHRQPQPEGLQRLQDGAGRPRDLRRRDPGACAGASRPRTTRSGARPHRRRWTSLAEYTQRIVGDCKLARPMKIVVDSGNGIAGASAPGILRALGCEVIELYSEVDGDFPNHHPDPSKPENLADLIARRAGHRRRARPGLRRRRRPPGHRHQGRPDHLPRPPADAVRAATCSRASRGAHHHLRRQVHAAPGAGDPRAPAASR